MLRRGRCLPISFNSRLTVLIFLLWSVSVLFLRQLGAPLLAGAATAAAAAVAVAAAATGPVATAALIAAAAAAATATPAAIAAAVAAATTHQELMLLACCMECLAHAANARRQQRDPGGPEEVLVVSRQHLSIGQPLWIQQKILTFFYRHLPARRRCRGELSLDLGDAQRPWRCCLALCPPLLQGASRWGVQPGRCCLGGVRSRRCALL